MKRLHILFTALLALLVLLGSSSSYSIDKLPKKEKKRVLILHSYHEGLTWTEGIDQGIRNILMNRPDLDLYFEYMDTKRRADKIMFQKLIELYALKYSNKKIDVVISSDDNALNFLLANRKKLFPGSKIVFCGVNNYRPEIRERNKNVTGVVERLNAAATIDLIIKLHPNLKKILVIGDQTITSRNTMRTVKDTVRDKVYKINFEYIDNIKMTDLQSRVSSLSKDIVIILLPYNREKGGTFYEYQESVATIASKSVRPIYSYWDFYLGYGLTGGFLISGVAQGETAARMAERILKGESIAKIPVLTRSPNVYEFDFKYTDKFGIKLSKLPPKSRIINEPISIFVKYENYIKVLLAFLFVMVIILLILWIVSSRSALNKLQEKDNKIQRELDLASDIQKGILPEMPFKHNGMNMVAYYNSMDKVGGDFYDIIPMAEGYTGLVIADVSGHGIPAAFITALAKISFQEASQKNRFPSDIFSSVNDEMIKTIKTHEYLTAFLIVISPSYEIYYGNASHQKGIIIRRSNKDIVSLDSHGLFVGAVSEATDMYEDNNDVLHFGDRLFLFTDGLIESRNEHEEEYGIDRLHKSLLQTMNLDIEEAKEKITEAWKQFIRGSEVKDDVSYVLLEIDHSYKAFLDHKNRAIELMYDNKMSDAIHELDQALGIDAENLDAHLLLAKCLFKEHQYLKAVDHLNKYLTQNNSDANAWYLLAVCYYNNQQYADSADAAQYACQLKPNFLKALIILGKSYKKTNREADATHTWRKVKSLDPQNSVAREELGESETVNI